MTGLTDRTSNFRSLDKLTWGFIFILGVLFTGAALLFAQDIANPSQQSIINAPIWLRWILFLLPVMISTYVALKYRVDAGQSRIISVQKEQLVVVDNQNKQFKEELINKDKEILELKGICRALEVKTDVTAVLNIIKDAQRDGDVRYAEAMKMLSDMMSEIQKSNFENHKLIRELFQLVNERWQKTG